ncbi:PAS domain-containing protein [Nostoc commune]|uniref:PAS domain-containing protein n=1 Tax=Nostoc commune TaxID=1178 RepID=UPI002074152C|nr:PAS domain-containing protein [Nostoc commune]
MNDRIAEVAGIQKEELQGRIIWEVFPDVVKTEFYTQVHRAMAQQTVVQFDMKPKEPTALRMSF